MQGLGKTVELLACLCANRFKGPRLPAELVSRSDTLPLPTSAETAEANSCLVTVTRAGLV